VNAAAAACALDDLLDASWLAANMALGLIGAQLAAGG
jgi:hypothetical protein